MAEAFDEILTIPAARLASAAPQQWKDFLAAAREYANARRDELVRSPREEIEKQQGRAQQCVKFAELLSDAVAAANREFPSRAVKPSP
jgi:hypothetical protein